MSIKIRLVSSPDRVNEKYIDIIDKLDEKIFGDGYGYPNKEKSYWWAVFNDDNIIGFAGLDTVVFKGKAFLCRAAINNEFRNIGLHKRLIIARERKSKKLGLKEIVTYTSHDNISSSNSLIKRGYIRYKPRVEYGIKNAIYFFKEL